MADLVRNNTDAQINLPGGFSIGAGEQKTLPLYVVDHPYTQSRLRNKRLEVVVEAKRTRKKKAVEEPVEVSEPEAPEAE